MGRPAHVLTLVALACLPPAALTPWPADPQTEPAAAIRLAGQQTPADPGDADPGTAVDPAPALPRPRVRTVTLALTGDLLVHDNVWASAAREAAGTRSAFDFRPLLGSLRPRLSGADLAICHLETPLAPPGGPYSGYPLFAAPQELAPALAWVGYDACSTASNHTVDQGFAGVARTLDVLDATGLRHTGSARSPAEARRIVQLRSHGLRVAWLSHTYGTNGMPVDPDKPWSVNLIDVPRILDDARRARAGGADAVIVALHWGDEYSHSPSAFQLDVADRLTRSDEVDLVYGHHAHVVQPIRRVNGTWVVFGLGNLLAGQGTTAPGVADGMVAEVTLRQRGRPGDWGPVRVLRPSYAPTHIDYSDPDGEFRVYDVRRALARGGLDAATRAELLASRAATATVLR